MKHRLKAWLAFLVFLWVLTTWFIILHYFTPTQMVSHLGVENSYFVFFLIAAIGGSSLITSSSYYITLPVLAIAGLNPVLLGVLGGLGISIGDSIYFYLGSKGRDISSGNVSERLRKISSFLEKSPKFLVILFIYLFSIIPFFPNDILTFILGIIGYPYRKMIVPLALGSMTGGIILAYLTVLGVDFFGF
jgi:uncharacterized membrane protein YdjX (TVP38/TMEM64 family)